jgi:hypothetical protein
MALGLLVISSVTTVFVDLEYLSQLSIRWRLFT